MYLTFIIINFGQGTIIFISQKLTIYLNNKVSLKCYILYYLNRLYFKMSYYYNNF